jgi:hypothetical protein
MSKIITALSLLLSFSAAHGATADAVDVANALLKVAHTPEFKAFTDNTTSISSVDYDDEGNGAGTFRLGGMYLNIDMVCGSSELVIRQEVVQAFFGPTTVYRATETHKKFCR